MTTGKGWDLKWILDWMGHVFHMEKDRRGHDLDWRM